MNVKHLIEKYKDIILYLFFGVSTTIVNIITYWFMAYVIKSNTIVSSTVAWFIAVLFAYLTNRKWVFHSKAKGKKEIFSEIISFFICRLATGIVDIAIMWIFVDKIGLNDMFIKVIANIVVIILNYIASKLVIFNQKNKDTNKNILIKVLILSIFFCITFVFLLNSPLHIWNNTNSNTDSSVFRTVGLMMENGSMPYRDTFDHKGPLIYLINLIALNISYNNGLFYIEFASAFISLCAIYKIARLKCNRTISVILGILSFTVLLKYFEGGNLVEEYALPFITISLFIFLDYYLNNKMNIIRLLICGACFGSVLLLRPNMISVWIVFCIAIFIKCIKEKKFKELIKYILFFVVGTGIVVTPFIIWLRINNVLSDFWQAYIVFNKEYSTARFLDKLDSFMCFYSNTVIILASIISAYIWLAKKEKIHMIHLLCMIVTLGLICISGMKFGHYGMVMIPFIVFPFASLYKEVSNESQKINGLELVITMYIIASFILPSWKNVIKEFSENYSNRNEIVQSYPENDIAEIIINKTNENDKISVYGNWDIIYVITKREHATKYSYQFPIGTVMPSIMDEYIKELGEELPKIIVIQAGTYNDIISAFLDNNNYSLIWKNNNEENLNNSALVFEKCRI